MTNFTHPVTSKVPVELLLQQMSIDSNKPLPETLCVILIHSGRLNPTATGQRKPKPTPKGRESLLLKEKQQAKTKC